MQNQLGSIGRTDAHFVFFFANGEARGVFRNDESSQTTDTAGFTGVSEYQENFCQTTVGDEHFGTVQSVGTLFLVVYSTGRNAACITACTGLGQCESSQTAVVQDIAIHFLLFVGACQQNRYSCQAVSSQRGCNTCAAFAQLFINGSNRNAVQAGAI